MDIENEVKVDAKQVQESGIVLHQFWADLPSCKYVFKSGKAAIFSAHMYRTSVKLEIDELNAEIEAGIGAIKVPESGATINSLDLDPAKVMKDKIIKEYLAEQARANSNGQSTSTQERLVPANTTTLAAVSSDSLSGAASAGSAAKVDLSHLKK